MSPIQKELEYIYMYIWYVCICVYMHVLHMLYVYEMTCILYDLTDISVTMN